VIFTQEHDLQESPYLHAHTEPGRLSVPTRGHRETFITTYGNIALRLCFPTMENDEVFSCETIAG
jgi:hypothetical protein